MPSADLFFYFQKSLRIVKHWRVNGRHYGLTSEAWLQNLDKNKDKALPILSRIYEKDEDGGMAWQPPFVRRASPLDSCRTILRKPFSAAPCAASVFAYFVPLCLSLSVSVSLSLSLSLAPSLSLSPSLSPLFCLPVALLALPGMIRLPSWRGGCGVAGTQHEIGLRWYGRWRAFFLACAECFAWGDGDEWFVSHYLFEKQSK